MPSSSNAGNPKRRLDLPALESWLWEAACQIRGPLDAPKFKDYTLPLIFLKRLSDVGEDEVAHLAHEFRNAETAAKLVEKDRGRKRRKLAASDHCPGRRARRPQGYHR